MTRIITRSIVAMFVACATARAAQEQGAKPAPPPQTPLAVKASGMKTLYLNPRAGNSQVSIMSESTLEDFTTVCNRVAGEIKMDPRHLETLTAKFSLNVADLKTGIALRDEHMRSADWLDAKKHSEVTIRVKRARDVRVTKGNRAALVLEGSCKLHGKTRPVEIDATLAYLDESPKTLRLTKGDLLRVRGDFEIKLSDYGITGPAGSDTIGLKVADTLKIKAAVFSSTVPPPDPLATDKQDTDSPTVKSPSLRAPKRPDNR